MVSIEERRIDTMARKAASGSGTIRKKTINRGGKEYTYWEARATVGHDPGSGKQIQRSFTGKTQKEVAEQAGISLSTVHKFESGSLTNVSFGNVIRLLRIVGAVENLQYLLPALPENPFLYKNMDFENKKRRVKHKNK